MSALSASAAHYAALLRRISDGQARSAASTAARAAGETRYWYFVSEDYCPPCGRTSTGRERVYGLRPEAWEDRHESFEVYDWCLG